MTSKPNFSEKTEQKARQYLEFGEVPQLLAQLRGKQYPVSDITFKDPESKRDLYFVDLVQQGGGVLGVALVGYTCALEAAGIRFLSLAGTSAGAINTLFLAGFGPPAMAKSEMILKEMCDREFSTFVDPGWRVLWPVKGMLLSPPAPKTRKNPVAEWLDKKVWRPVLKVLFVLLNLVSLLLLIVLNLWGLCFKKGLCSGNSFEQWVKKMLNDREITTMAELKARMKQRPEGLKMKQPDGRFGKKNIDKIEAHLSIISADITTQTKVDFPKYGDLYAPDAPETARLRPEQVVRASMAIPVFYRPKYFFPPEKGQHLSDHWRLMAAYRGTVPDKITMVDGGIMSNFPIDVFHQTDRTPKRPTFGVRLGLSREKFSPIKNLLALLGASFDGARNLRDFEFLFRNEDYQHLVKYIDTADYNWLDFSISEQKKQELFELGVKAAYEFLEGKTGQKGFNWRQYQALRRRMLFFSSTDRMESLWKKEDAIRKLGLDERGMLSSMSRQASQFTAPVNGEKPSHDGTAWSPENFQIFNKHLKTIQAYTEKGQQVGILWIDDDPANDCFELSVLRAFNIDFVTALSSEDAMDLLEAPGASRPRLIVSDSNRQGKFREGLNFCKQLARQGVGIPVILHSVSLARFYEGKATAKQPDFIAQIRKNYSPHIVDNFIDARELVINIVKEIAEGIVREKKGDKSRAYSGTTAD